MSNLSNHRLDPLFRPRSIAILGASGRAHRPGYEVIRNLHDIGFQGTILPITPRYHEVEGHPCFDDLDALDTAPDFVVIAGASERMEAELGKVIDCGARAALVFANAFLPGDAEPRLLARIRSLASEAALPLLGPNTIGYVHPAARTLGCWVRSHHYQPGTIGLVIQSGSTFSYANNLDPRVRYSISIQPGQEAVVGVGECMDYVLDTPNTRVLGLYLETVRAPEPFLAALEKAQRLRVPVVAIKLGRSALGAELVVSHSGRLAGTDSAFEAVFEKFGVLRCRTLDEWWTTLRLMNHLPRPGAGGIAAIMDSGGQRAYLSDLAADIGVRWSDVNETTRDRLSARLDPALPAINPVDAWGGEPDWDSVFEDCFRAVVHDPDTALGIMFTEYGSSNKDVFPETLAKACKAVARTTGKPVIAASFTSRQMYPDLLSQLDDEGLLVLDGGDSTLRAVNHAFNFRDRPITAPPLASKPPTTDVVERWRGRLLDGRLGETDTLALLSDFGVSVVRSLRADSEDAALAAARTIGFPIALKTAASDVAHKSDSDGVHLGLENADTLARAYGELAGRLGPVVTVQAMAPHGVELALGIVRDPDFGPLVMIGAGGVLIELLDDARFALPPVSAECAKGLVEQLKVYRILTGYRGRTACDVNALSHTLERLSVLAVTLGDLIAELDINPMIATTDGCIAVDALLVPAP